MSPWTVFNFGRKSWSILNENIPLNNWVFRFRFKSVSDFLTRLKGGCMNLNPKPEDVGWAASRSCDPCSPEPLRWSLLLLPRRPRPQTSESALAPSHQWLLVEEKGDTCAVCPAKSFQFIFLFSGYSHVTHKMSSPVNVPGNALQKKKFWVFKSHISQKLSTSTKICWLVELQSKFILFCRFGRFFWNYALHVTNWSVSCCCLRAALWLFSPLHVWAFGSLALQGGLLALPQ